MFEAIIWDDRDKDSPEPSSQLGEFPTQDAALEAIREYLAMFPEHASHIYKTEVVEVSR